MLGILLAAVLAILNGPTATQPAAPVMLPIPLPSPSSSPAPSNLDTGGGPRTTQGPQSL